MGQTVELMERITVNPEQRGARPPQPPGPHLTPA